MKTKNQRLIFLILMALFVFLACDRVTNPVGYQIAQYLNMPSENEKSREPTGINITPTQTKAGLPDCDATRYVDFSIEKTRDTVNEYKTELFEFTIHIRNSHPTESIYLLGLVHRTDIYKNLNESEWVRLNTLKSGEMDNRYVYHNIYHEDGIEGPTFYLIERLAGILESTECSAYLTNEPFLSTRSVKLEYDY